MTNTNHILIANATGPTNVGDLAMLDSLVTLLKQACPTIPIVIHSSVPELYPRSLYLVKHTLYSWMAFDNPKFFTRIIRLIWLLIALFSVTTHIPLPLPTRLDQIVSDYRHARIIFFVGGGYLRARRGLTQTLNALMSCFPFRFASYFDVPRITSPISFGPYAYRWVEKYAANSLKTMTLVAARETYSYSKLNDYGIIPIRLSADHALLIPPIAKKIHRTRCIGITLRNWLPYENQRVFEKAVVSAVVEFARANSYIIQPVVQVNAPLYGEDDLAVAKRLYRLLRRYKVRVRTPQVLKTTKKACEYYASLHMIVGMRMHSNILAATQHTPFVAIAYEHKTIGISELLGMDSYVLRVEDATKSNLVHTLNRLESHYQDATLSMIHKLKDISDRENTYWKKLLRDLK